MQFSPNGTLTGAVGTQQFWYWPLDAETPTIVTTTPQGGAACWWGERLIGIVADPPQGPTDILTNKELPWPASGLPLDQPLPNQLLAYPRGWLASTPTPEYELWGTLDTDTVDEFGVVVLAVQADGSYATGDPNGFHRVQWANGTSTPYAGVRIESLCDDLVFGEVAPQVVLYRRGTKLTCAQLPGQNWPIQALLINGTPWVCYVNDAVGVVLHPAADAARYRVLTIGDAYGTVLTVRGDTLWAAWNRSQGETASGAIRTSYPVANLLPSITPPPPPPPPPEPPMIPDYSDLVRQMAPAFDLRTKAGCGRLIEAVAIAGNARDKNIGHLRKKPGQNQWREHAVDNVLFKRALPDLSIAIDCVYASESTDPNEVPAPAWNPDIPRYTPDDWVDPRVEGRARPALTRRVIGITAFDAAARVARGDARFLDYCAAEGIEVLRVAVCTKHRDVPRTPAQGAAQLPAFFAACRARNLRVELIVNVDTADLTTPGDVGLIEIRQHTAEVNALCLGYADVITLIQLCNQNTHGVEREEMRDMFFLQELDALIDPRFPVAWGGWHDDVPLVGGSVVTVHPPRGESAHNNALDMVSISRLYGKPVLNDEPLGVANTPKAQRTDRWQYGAELAAATVATGLAGAILHLDAGLTANVDDLGPVGSPQRKAVTAFVAGMKGGPVDPPPPPPPPPPVGATDRVISQDGRYEFVMQNDGNAVVYGPDGPEWSSKFGPWGSVGG